MKALVIGGNRFIGKRLVSHLLDRGIEVTLLNRGQRQDDFGLKVKRIVLDRKLLCKNHPALGNEKWDIIYDQVCYDDLEAQSACKAFQGRVQRYIFISSQSVYKPGQAILETAFDPRSHSISTHVDRAKDYAEAKRQAEAVFFKEATFPVAAVRFPIVLGEDDYTERLAFHIDHILNAKPIFFPNTEAKISFIQSADAAAFLNFLFDHEITGPINCCSPEPISLIALVKAIESATGKIALLSKDSTIDHSPFGIESDWYMDVAQLNEYGFRASPIETWLPILIEKYAKKESPKTSTPADDIQQKIYSQMSFAKKWEEICRIREVAWTLKTAGVKASHPNWNDQEVEAEVRRIFLYATT
jgi:nucleoside-diphosphate-sugar epimerase